MAAVCKIATKKHRRFNSFLTHHFTDDESAYYECAEELRRAIQINMKRKMFVLDGDFSKEFLEKMGYKPFQPDPIYIDVNAPLPPLKTVKLAYEMKPKETQTKEENMV